MKTAVVGYRLTESDLILLRERRQQNSLKNMDFQRTKYYLRALSMEKIFGRIIMKRL